MTTNQDTIAAPQQLAMAVGEKYVYVFDFTNLLKSGETIDDTGTAPTVVASISSAVTVGAIAKNSGTIAIDLAAGINAAIAAGKAVTVVLTGLLARTLTLSCTVHTSDGNIRRQDGVLTILP